MARKKGEKNPCIFCGGKLNFGFVECKECHKINYWKNMSRGEVIRTLEARGYGGMPNPEINR